ncbi:MAG: outer membrane protein assembly factor BamA, partial [Muribaculaceae bacterium]|nr:outer membrane protein assembly factor BamA [Muribaculaceae bacterium]
MNNLIKVSLISFLMAGASSLSGLAQAPAVANDTIYNPDIIYSPLPRSYEIAGINVEGISHVDDYIIVANSGLSVGERVEVPGDALTNATKR